MIPSERVRLAAVIAFGLLLLSALILGTPVAP